MSSEAERVTSIYLLVDPRNRECRYVGKTVLRPEQRLSAHIRAACRGDDSHRGRWIRSVLADGLLPEVFAVDQTHGDWAAAECFWIAYMRAIGARLTNCTDGGEGCVGRVTSSKTRALIGARQKGKKLSDRHRAILSQRHKGVHKTQTHKQGISLRRQEESRAVKRAAEAAFSRGLSMKQMVESGFSMRAVGRLFGVCHHTVKSRISGAN